MEPRIEDFLAKVKTIDQGPNAELFRKLVDVLCEPELSYLINVDLLRDVTSKLKAIKDLCNAIKSQQDILSDGEAFAIVGRISVAARMALDNLNDPILHEID
jgi:hypothetical protein